MSRLKRSTKQRKSLFNIDPNAYSTGSHSHISASGKLTIEVLERAIKKIVNPTPSERGANIWNDVMVKYDSNKLYEKLVFMQHEDFLGPDADSFTSYVIAEYWKAFIHKNPNAVIMFEKEYGKS